LTQSVQSIDLDTCITVRALARLSSKDKSISGETCVYDDESETLSVQQSDLSDIDCGQVRLYPHQRTIVDYLPPLYLYRVIVVIYIVMP